MKQAQFGTMWIVLALLCLPEHGAAQNPYYDHGSFPAPGTVGSSAGMRAELDLIEAGFAKLPTLSGNANKIVVINSSATAMTATDAPIPNGTTFPASPGTGALFIVTDDSVAGACDSAAGSAVTLCRWSGSAWVGLGGGGSTSWSALLATGAMSTSESVPFSIRGTGGQAANGRDLYQSSGGVWTDVCVVASVQNACHYIRQLSATYSFEIRNASAAAIFTVSNDTGALTNVTLNTESTGNTITVQEEAWWDVAACQNSTASLIWDVPTANSPAATCDTGSNTQKAYASFDAATDESFEMNWVLPTGFTGAIDIHFIWKAAATSGATGWCAQLIRVADGSTSDPAYPAQASGNCVSDTAKGTTLQENHATITGVTCSSCAARDHVYVRISRDANGGAVTDDMTGDAHLMRVGRTWRVAK